MIELLLHEFHSGLGGRFGEVAGLEVVEDYGDAEADYGAWRASAGVADLSFRGRLALTGADRRRFLHGQVTNQVLDLHEGDGCYAALVTAKGKMQSDLNIYCLPGELILDFEPGLSGLVVQRLEKFIIADDVQVAEVAPYYGLLSVQGPKSAAVVSSLALNLKLPTQCLSISSVASQEWGEVYCVQHSRSLALGFDLWVPVPALEAMAARLVAAARGLGGRPVGWKAMEMARIEAGIPRFGWDMDETHLPPETGIEARAVSYTKGCYIGQEVLARLRTYGHVAKALRGLRLPDELPELPRKGDKLVREGKEVGYLTSVVRLPAPPRTIALGYVRREHDALGTILQVLAPGGACEAKIVPLPFQDGDGIPPS